MEKIDIHSHILPGLDDGAKDEKESLKMFRMAAEDNIRHMIMTPHLHYKRGHAASDKIRDLTITMQEILNDEEIPIQLYAGNELHYSHELIEMVKEGEALTLADSDYILLEFSYETEKRKIQNAIYQFLTEGYYPVIAHVERYQAFQKDINFGRMVSDMGAYLQINTESLMRTANWRTRHYVNSMLKDGKIHFIATDAHDAKLRQPQFGKVPDRIRKKYGELKIENILYKNPKLILENKVL